MTKQMSCQVTWQFSKLLMLVNGGGGDKSFVPLCRDHQLSHLCGWRIIKLLDLVECLDNQHVEGNFTTVILCMYHS